MTHFYGRSDDHADTPGESAEVVALEVASAVELLADLWSEAGRDPALRLSVSQLRALRALETVPDMNLTALAVLLDIGLPAASRLCDRLQAAGLMVRASHPLSRREVRLSLTPGGRHLLRDMARRRTQALADALREMEPAQRRAMKEGLTAFLRANNA
ncbi:MarR family transcriptional regulator [Streptomyces sp. NPDC095817]|uniref:MarR family winged helix-turn-helix transcriptional regulator n=1 Tax=Streptomyces sp. NPDC095817 TaxID=3155082 RepID=UPI00332EF244